MSILASIPTQRSVTWLDTTDANSQAVRVFFPAVPGATPPLVVVNHAYAGSTLVGPGTTQAYPMVHELVNAGYVAVVSNNHGNSWTSDTGIADGPAAEVCAKSTLTSLGVTGFSRIVLCGFSMGGGLSVMQAKLASFTAPVKGVYLVDPGLNLRNLYYTNPVGGVVRASIDTAFGGTAGTLSAAIGSTGATSLPTTASFPTVGTQLLVGIGTANEEIVTTTGASTGTTVAVTATTHTHASGEALSNYPTKTAGHDPTALTSAQIPTGLRWRFVASPNDATVLKTTNTDAFRTLIAGMTTQPAEYPVDTHNDDHLSTGPGAFWARDCVEFANRCV